ncbi:MAG: PTS transporter subunit EIIC [Oscillospiraceae bacterium]|jgi:PTS system N-acetylglucosamine-specific IIC component|nr:PTS transporter subunit EIIC [Oscillospiraceae bacterium]
MQNLVLKSWNRLFVALQKLAKAMSVPLTIVPFIILLNALGQHFEVLSSVGKYMTIYLPVIFAAGVAVGLSGDKDSYTAVGGVAFYIVGASLVSMPHSMSLGTFHGIIAGICAAMIYNTTKNINMPIWLSFLGGYRLALILTIIAGLFVNLSLQSLFGRFDMLGLKVWRVVFSHRALGAFVYGILNRLLLPSGLHHLLNNFVLTQLGEFNGVKGEINRFCAGDTTAGYITGGVFPVSLFGLPAAALAMFLCTPKTKRKNVAMFTLTAALNSIFAGITEPIEYMFIFVSPFLYFLHIILTGVAHFLAAYFDIRVIFSFAAGLLDYTVNGKFSANRELIVYVGVVLFAVYFFTFYSAIKLFKIKTFYPIKTGVEKKNKLAPAKDTNKKSEGYILAEKYIQALGGSSNISELFSCTTRLRLSVYDMSLVDDEAILGLGALGTSKTGSSYLQIIIGIGVGAIFKEMNEIWSSEKENNLQRR